MENTTKIGIGVVVLAGVGYYFYNKNKSSMISSTIVDEPKKTGFDREKASKEFAGFGIKFVKSNEERKLKDSLVVVKGTIGGLGLSGVDTLVNNAPKQQITELFLYKRMLAMLNEIPDDSDAEFTLNQFYKMYEAGDDRNYKPDLDTQIRLEKIQQKYPNALKQMDLG